MAEDDFVDITIHKQLKRGKQSTASTSVKQEHGVDKVTVENFQRMLQQQADALVELGYDSSLKVGYNFTFELVVVIVIVWFLSGTTQVLVVCLFGLVH